MNASTNQTTPTLTPNAPLSAPGSDNQDKGPLPRIVRLAALALALALLVGGGSWFWFGSFPNTMAYIGGYSLIAESDTATLDSLPAGREAVVRYRLRNLTFAPITVVGAVSSCSCIAVDDLPLTIGAGEVAEFSLRFTPGQDSVGSQVEHTALLYLDVKNPPILLKATARVVLSSGI